MLKCCLENQITLGDGKIQAGEEVTFGGYVVSSKGIKPDPTKIEAIKNFLEPKDLTNLKSFIGVSKQFGDFSPDLHKACLRTLKRLIVKEKRMALE